MWMEKNVEESQEIWWERVPEGRRISLRNS